MVELGKLACPYRPEEILWLVSHHGGHYLPASAGEGIRVLCEKLLLRQRGYSSANHSVSMAWHLSGVAETVKPSQIQQLFFSLSSFSGSHLLETTV